jgi:hypothetical protein
MRKGTAVVMAFTPPFNEVFELPTFCAITPVNELITLPTKNIFLINIARFISGKSLERQIY